MKLFRAFFVENDGIDAFDVLVAELLFLLTADSLVLAQEHVRGVAGAPLSGKEIADFLDLQVCQGGVLQFDHNIGNQQCAFIGNACGIVGQDIENPDFLSKKQILCSHLLELF